MIQIYKINMEELYKIFYWKIISMFQMNGKKIRKITLSKVKMNVTLNNIVILILNLRIIKTQIINQLIMINKLQPYLLQVKEKFQ